MQKIYFILLLMLFSSMVNAQDPVQDLSNEVCKCLEKNRSIKGSSLLEHCIKDAVSETPGLPKSKEKFNKLISRTNLYLQENCPNYIDLLNTISEQKGDWVRLDSNVISELDSTECANITNYTKLYYLENSGDTTYLTIKNGLWQDFFKAGTYSKCEFKWTSACEFELTFIQSNEPSRDNVFQKGKKYYYRIIDKTGTYYILTAHYGTVWQKFNIYFQ